MSDDKAQQEPSMEDILASIRRILSEDDAEEAVKAPPPAEPEKAEPSSEPEPLFEPEPEPMFEPEPEPLFEPEPEPVFEPHVELEPDLVLEDESEDDVLELTDEMVAEEEAPVEEPEMEPLPFHVAPEPEPEPEVNVTDEESFLSRTAQSASTSSFAELARAVAHERGLGLGNGGLTLEDIVREILKSLIKEWLDQNLPYMIERIVKKEIEKMVNRAEKL